MKVRGLLRHRCLIRSYLDLIRYLIQIRRARGTRGLDQGMDIDIGIAAHGHNGVRSRSR